MLNWQGSQFLAQTISIQELQKNFLIFLGTQLESQIYGCKMVMNKNLVDYFLIHKKKFNHFFRITKSHISFHDLVRTFRIRNNSLRSHLPKCENGASIHMKLVVASYCGTKGQDTDFTIRVENFKQSLKNFEISSSNATTNQF